MGSTGPVLIFWRRTSPRWARLILITFLITTDCFQLPQYIILPILYNTIVYWLSGLYPNFWNYCFASLVTVLITNVAISICEFLILSEAHRLVAAYAVATIFANTDVAMTVLPIFVVPIMAFGGFFITFDAIPSYFTWLSSLSYFKSVHHWFSFPVIDFCRYGYEALAINEWESIPVIPECFNTSVTAYALNNCPKNGLEVLDSVRFKNQSIIKLLTFLLQIDFSAANKMFDIAILFVMFIGIRIIAYFALLVRSYNNNWFIDLLIFNKFEIVRKKKKNDA